MRKLRRDMGRPGTLLTWGCFKQPPGPLPGRQMNLPQDPDFLLSKHIQQSTHSASGSLSNSWQTDGDLGVPNFGILWSARNVAANASMLQANRWYQFSFLFFRETQLSKYCEQGILELKQQSWEAIIFELSIKDGADVYHVSKLVNNEGLQATLMKLDGSTPVTT